MTSDPPDPHPERLSLREWITSLAALRRLLGDVGRTEDVFRIVRFLNIKAARRAYRRLLSTGRGGRLAFERRELRPLLGDPGFLARFAPGSVGAAYARFVADTGYSAEGLAEISRRDDTSREAPHPYAWFARRQRDTHDVWHVLTGYRADDPLGEACLVGFTYAQMGGAGWRLILLGAMLKALPMSGGVPAVRAMVEGYRRGRRASWLADQDYETLLAEPLDGARRRLTIAPAPRYDHADSLRAAWIAQNGGVSGEAGAGADRIGRAA